MKRQALVILTTLSLLVMLTTSVNAQSDLRLKVNIPFEFSVRGKIFPAGQYIVRHRAQGFLLIQSADLSVSQIVGASSTQRGENRNQSSLVFNRYGDQYFLSKVWKAGRHIGFEVRRADTEQRLIRARRSLSEREWKRHTVTIVADR
jgi:hypothetical protein